MDSILQLVSSLSLITMMEPMASPLDMIGEINIFVFSVFSLVMFIFLSFKITVFLSFIYFSRISLISSFKYFFLSDPDILMNLSVSDINTFAFMLLFNVSAIVSLNSCMLPSSEYFFKTMVSSFIKISKFSPFFIWSVFLISLGTTFLHSSSIILTIPANFIFSPLSRC